MILYLINFANITSITQLVNSQHKNQGISNYNFISVQTYHHEKRHEGIFGYYQSSHNALS